MVKRKAEGAPCIDPYCEIATIESNQVAELSQVEHVPTYLPAGEDQREGVPTCHLDPVQSNVAEAPG